MTRKYSRKEWISFPEGPDGRQVLNTDTAAGKREYRRRTLEARAEQCFMCAICFQFLPEEMATADHIKKRKMGGGFRDDRQENIRAVHLICNQMREQIEAKSSRII